MKLIKNSRHFELFLGFACLIVGIVLIAFDFYKNTHQAEEKSLSVEAKLSPQDDFKKDLIGSASDKDKQGTILELSASSSLSKPLSFTRDYVVKKDMDFLKYLMSKDINKKTSQHILKVLGSHYKSKQVKRGQRFYLFYSKILHQPSLQLNKIIFLAPPGKKFSLIRGADNCFSLEYPPFYLPHRLKYFKGTIVKSIYTDALKTGMNKTNLNKLTKLLSYSFDLQRSIQRGDKFEVLIEKPYDTETGFVDAGSIVYVNLITRKQKQQIYRYALKEDQVEYFDENGNGIRKALLQTPIKGGRVNSGFGMRMHPILGFTKLHKGVDFRARTGTPIMAAGDGVVQKIGYLGSYGNYILIKHSAAYSTAYAHLSRYAKQLHKGMRVKQGDIIGYVGATGRATGPHLHYEVMFKNNQINPKNIKMPSQRNLSGFRLNNFNQYKKHITQKIWALTYS